LDVFGAHEFFQAFAVFAKDGFGLDGILQALQICIQGRWAIRRQRVKHPVLVSLGGYKLAFPEVSKMPGNNDLRFAERLLNVADAQGRNGEQIKDSKPGFVAQTLVNREQFHDFQYTWTRIYGKRYVLRLNASTPLVPKFHLGTHPSSKLCFATLAAPRRPRTKEPPPPLPLPPLITPHYRHGSGAPLVS